VAEEAGAGNLVEMLESLTRRVEAAAALVERLRRRVAVLEEENRALALERQEVSARLTALIEKVDLLPDDS
jgi:regulator of replication initiation timing